MAESNLSSKKRKQHSYPVHHPLAGIFTRSKSQIYLHCNRSGRARADSTSLNLYSASKKPRNILDSPDVDDLSRTPIKDLRTRRVFSDGCGFRGADDEGNTNGKSGSGFAFKSCFVAGEDYLADAKVRDDEGDMEKFDSGFCSQVVGCINRINPSLNGSGLSSKESRGDVKAGENGDYKINENCSLVMEKPRNNEECDISSGVGNLNEECIQTTPPDIELLADKQSNGSSQKNDDCIAEALIGDAATGNGTNSMTKPVFSRSRVKLFKTPGSFSYRRLLPYLTDISKDNSCALKTLQSSKSEKVQEEKKFSSPHCQGVLLNEPEKESSPGKSHNVDSLSMLNSKAMDCITEPSVLSHSQNEVCMGRDSPVSLVEEWSKSILDRGLEESLIKISGKDQNLKNSSHDLCLNKDKSFSTNFVCVVPNENGESKTSYAQNSSDPQNMRTVNCSSSSIMDNSYSNNDNANFQSFEDTKRYTTDGLDKSDAGGSPVGRNLHHMNFNFSGEEQSGILSSSGGNDNNDVEVLDHSNNSDEECVRRTPADGDIFVQPKLLENHGGSVKRSLHSVDNVLGKPLDGNGNEFSSSNDKSVNFNPGRNLVLKRCSRLKLVKNPGSMNYKRMLPFLIDNSCAPGTCECLKLQKSLEANLLSSSPLSVCQQMPTGNSNGNCHYTDCDVGLDCHGCNSFALPSTIPVTSSNDQAKVSSSFQHVNEYPEPLNSQQKWEVYTDRRMESDHSNMEVIHENKPFVTPLNSFLSSGSLPREDAKLVSHASYVDICKSSVTEVPNGTKQVEPERQHSSQPGDSFHLDMPVIVHKRGILKRTPRGCRGPCTCLNCSSFRLHAERAFEFSRNLMQDAEEVAFDLIRELSYVRNLLEKSTFGADGHAAVCVNQVKEACKRASEAEVVAQNRLSQMNFDLDIHCRLTCDQRPRVRFSNYVEEKFIKESASPSK